jgi:hypothetical protein
MGTAGIIHRMRAIFRLTFAGGESVCAPVAVIARSKRRSNPDAPDAVLDCFAFGSQ